MIQSDDAAIGASDAGESVRFFGEAHKLRICSCTFEGNKSLFSLFDGAAVIVFAVNDKRRRFAVTEIFDRLKSLEPHMLIMLLTLRWATADLKRLVCPTTHKVM